MDREALKAAMSKAATVKPRAVHVAEWGGDVYVKPLTVADMESDPDATESQNKHRLARSLARSICDETGTRMFDPDNAEDVALIASQKWSTLRGILDAANELNAATPEAVAKLGEASPAEPSS